jgi:hypothetical protein
MCLVTEQTKALTAKEDIICYKLVDEIYGEIRSVYVPSFVWIPNQLNQTKLVQTKKHKPYDSRAAFAYPDPEMFPQLPKKNYTIISEGFHAAKFQERLDSNKTLVRCIIPKGSKYFEDVTGLIVANQMILVKIIAPPQHPYTGYSVNVP